MPPPGHEPFLRAICADPDDDTVRLVYADWLDENGDPDRAEFIRLQVAVPEQPKEFDPRYARAVELRKAHGAAWIGELPQLSGITWPFRFWRGFTGGVQASTGKWLVHHREVIFSAAPIQFLTVCDVGLATLTKVLELAEVDHLIGLSFLNSRIKPGEWHVLARCPRLSRLEWLQFDAPRVGMGGRVTALSDADTQEFVQSNFLPRLQFLRIHGGVSDSDLLELRARFKTVRTW